MLTKTQATLFIVAATVVVWLGWQYDHRPVVGKDQAVETTEAKEVAGEPKHEAPVEKVQAYKPKTKEALGLPPSVAKDEDKLAVAASDIRASDHDQEVTAVLDVDTGEVTQYVRDKPLPWAALEFGGRVGARYGFNFAGHQTAGVGVQQDLLRMKRLHIYGAASADQDLEDGDVAGFYGVGIEYKW